VGYLKPESVTLAMDMLDGAEITPGHKITITKAEFKMKGTEFVKKVKVADPQAAALKKRLPKQADKALGWADDDEAEVKGQRIVILKHVFTLEEAKGNDNYYDELRV
jgi:hypothetical protein